MSQRYKDNTKRPKPKENQLRNLKGLGSRRELLGLRIYKNTSRKVAASSP